MCSSAESPYHITCMRHSVLNHVLYPSGLLKDDISPEIYNAALVK